MRLLGKQLEAQGFPTVKTLGHAEVARVAGVYAEKFDAGSMAALPATADDAEGRRQAELFDVTAAVNCKNIAGQKAPSGDLPGWNTAMGRTGFHRAKRLYKAELGKIDFARIRREVHAVMLKRRQGEQRGQGQGGRERRWRLPVRLMRNDAPGQLPLAEPFERLLRHRGEVGDTKVVALAVLLALDIHLGILLDNGAEAAPALPQLIQETDLGGMRRRVGMATLPRFEEWQDVAISSRRSSKICACATSSAWAAAAKSASTCLSCLGRPHLR